ncbi:MAG: VWA domain-containing protein [Bryobacteraceae bacterium]|jgi:Ca-activated chloride channel family protein
MRRIAWAGALLLAALSARGEDKQPVFQVDVHLVRVLATVKDGSGQLIGSLSKDDFQILDNGVPQQLAVFEHRTEQPLSITVMIDTSASTGIDLKYEVDSVNRFFRALFHEGNPDDAAGLLAFNWETIQLADFTHNLDRLDRALRGIRSEGGTSLYDSIYLAAGRLEGREGRHVIIAVTDGGDTTSYKTYHDALRAAQMSDTVVYPVLVVPITNDAGRNTGGENALTTLAQSTGGRVFAPALGDALDAAFLEIIRDLRTQYLLAYYPKNVPLTKDPFHRIEIRLKRPDLRVSARSGYYGETEPPKGVKGWRPAK